MFQNTRLQLTGWYLLIIMTVSIAFSISIYIGANREFDRILRIQRFRIEHPVNINPNMFFWQKLPAPLEPTVVEDAKARVLEGLIGINTVILFVSALLGYFLAGRTLKPIQKMMDEQDRFITDASHELRTPLTSLRTEIEVGLRSKNMSLFEAKDLLKSNLEEVIALQALSDDLLDLAHSDHKKPTTFSSVLLKKIIQQAISRVSLLAKNKQITIQEKIEEAEIRGQQDRLTEVLIILLDNAIKYSPTKSIVTLTSKTEDHMVNLSISNKGTGIAPEDLPHIFDRFYRSNKSRSKIQAQGYGLGLSIAKKIIESHGGTITVTSIPGRITFTIHLPK